MKIAAKASVTLAAIFFFLGCQQNARPARSTTAAAAPVLSGAVSPSARLMVGRIIAVDLPRGFAFVELSGDAPMAATAPATELIARTLDLRETASLRTSRYLRGRTLRTTIVSGKPALDDEVVWLAP